MRTEMKRPMVYAAVFSAAAAFLCSKGVKPQLTIAALVLCAAACAAVVRRGLPIFAAAVLLAAVTAGGFSAQLSRAERLDRDYSGKTITLEGEVYAAPTVGNGREIYVLKTELGQVELTRYTAGVAEAAAEAGDTVSLRARLSAPSLPDNDYGFNRREYQYSRRIFLTAVGEGKMRVEKCSSLSLRVIAARLRQAAVHCGEKQLRGDALGLFAAIVYGDRGHMSRALRNNLSVAGLSHVAAVSGMHLSAVAVVIMFLFSKLFGRGRAACGAAILAVLAFTLLTGAGSSVVRACIMSVIYLLSQMLYRDADPISSLAAAVTLMLVFNPMTIYSVSFRLSVLATLGILLFEPLWRGRLSGLPKPLGVLAETLLVCIAAQLGVFPVLIGSFNAFPTYFLLANLAVVPILGVIMPLGLLLPLLYRIPFAGRLWSALCSAAFGYIAAAAEKAAELPSSTVTVGSLSPLFVLGYIAFAAALWLVFSSHKRGAAAAAALSAVLICTGGFFAHAEADKITLSFINVGRGDCALFSLPDGKHVLIDGGKAAYPIEDFLAGKGISKLEAAVLTSDGSEHIRGLLELVEDGCVERLFIPSALTETGSEARYLAAKAESEGVKTTVFGENTQISVGGLRLRQNAYNGGASLLASCGGVRILFCADKYTPWAENCLIVKMPGHGGGRYNYYNELSKSGAEYAVVTGVSGSGERGGFADALKELNVESFVPAERGTVTFELRDGTATVRTTK